MSVKRWSKHFGKFSLPIKATRTLAKKCQDSFVKTQKIHQSLEVIREVFVQGKKG